MIWPWAAARERRRTARAAREQQFTDAKAAAEAAKAERYRLLQVADSDRDAQRAETDQMLDEVHHETCTMSGMMIPTPRPNGTAKRGAPDGA